jgi:hypothetical protein
MTTYRNIHGRSIQAVTTDPTESVAEGQVWYNTTSDTFKSVVALESFTSVSALNTARDALQIGSVGTQTAGIAFGGRTHPPESLKNETEEYNGSGWSESGNLNDARFAGAGFGTQTAAVMAGGNRPGSSPDGRSDVEEYDGSSWTNATDIPAGRYGAMGAGTLTAGIVAGGATGTYPFTAQSTSFEYDGTNWTSGGTMNKGRWIGASGGPQTAALFFGGSDTTGSPNTTNTESYDGTSFTALSALPTAVRSNMGSGDTSSAVSYGGGNPSAVTTAFTWDGSSWSTSPATLGTARDEGSSSGTGSAAVTGGGSPPDAGLTISEEYNKTENVITAAAWASGGTLPITMRQNMSFGTQTAAINCGGYAPPGTKNDSLSYDGTSWTATPDLNAAARFGGVAGTQGAGLQFAGIQPDTSLSANVQSWNGSTWSNNPYNVSTGTYGNMGCGTQSAALKLGGAAPPPTNTLATTEEYDGEGWTAGGTMPNPRYGGGGNGLQTTCVFAGGDDSVGPPSTSTTSAEYDGTSWTAGGSLSDARGSGAMGAGASSDSALVFGGAPAQSFNEGYDGTAFSSRPSLATGRGFSGGNGIETAALIVAGGPPSGTTTNVEEFTGETTALNVKTLTQS